MSCASSLSLKEKEIQKKRNIKSRKIDKRKRKMLVSKVFHNKLVQDYKKLDQVTIKDKMPLPLIEEVINKLKKAKYFNKLDLI